MDRLHEFLRTDLGTFLGLLTAAYILWLALKDKLHQATVNRAASTCVAFCLHCNWEGRVDRARMRCGRCGCTKLSVSAT